MAEPKKRESASDRRLREEQERLPPEARVRDQDLEPFAALRYIARLFKFLAILLLLLLVAEIVLGLMEAGVAALANLLIESTQLLVYAGFLWSVGDIALMLIETNHDLRATRILVGRLHGQVDRLMEERDAARGSAGHPEPGTSRPAAPGAARPGGVTGP